MQNAGFIEKHVILGRALNEKRITILIEIILTRLMEFVLSEQTSLSSAILSLCFLNTSQRYGKHFVFFFFYLSHFLPFGYCGIFIPPACVFLYRTHEHISHANCGMSNCIQRRFNQIAFASLCYQHFYNVSNAEGILGIVSAYLTQFL